MKSGRKAGKDTFELRGRKFEKRLNRAIKRDLTPIDADRTNSHAEELARNDAGEHQRICESRKSRIETWHSGAARLPLPINRDFSGEVAVLRSKIGVEIDE